MSVSYAPRKLICTHYTVGILCALDKELLAVRALFDEIHPDIPTVSQDTNHYALGRIGRHNTVTTCLPAGEYGTGAASEVVQNLLRSFHRVEFCLLVGIGGAVPSPDDHDIRLGDVVVSHPNGRYPAVLQYDMGKFLGEGDFQITGTLQPPPRLLMKAISKLKSNPDPRENSLRRHLEKIGHERKAYRFPGAEMDNLYASDSWHVEGPDCRNCTGQVNRTKRVSDQPQVHYGPIASANQVMRSSKQRDMLAAKHKFLCFEMEAAGVMSSVPSLVIRGICDYADSHKNKVWQEYASAAAASYAKLLLSVLRDHVRDHETVFLPIESASSPSKETSQPEGMDTSEDVGLATAEAG
jgi:nucleoside phosphorylase